MVERDSNPDLTAVLKAAADPTRRAILTLLAQHGPTRVTDLAKHFDMSLNSVSKHIKTLESAHLVSRRTEWREHLIELQQDRIRLIDQWFTELRSIWEMRLDALETLMTEEKPMIDLATELRVDCDRVIAAPAEKLFDAWLDPERLASFMRPGEGVTVAEATTDAEVGGRFMIMMRVGEKELPHSGTYKTIDRPNRLAFTWESANSTEDGSTVTVDFEPAEGGTQVRLSHVRFPSEESRSDHEGGWARILDTLANQF